MTPTDPPTCRSIRLLCALLAGLWLSASVAGAAAPDVGSDPTTQLAAAGGRIALRLGPLRAGCSLESLIDRKAQRDLTLANRPIWSVVLQHASGEKVTLSSAQCRDATIQRSAPTQAVISWPLGPALESVMPQSLRDDGDAEARRKITARCTIRLDATTARLRLTIDNTSEKWSLREIVFPLLYVKQLGPSDDDDVLVVPRISGRLTRRPLTQAPPFSGLYPSGSTPMQFCAYFDDAGGLYVATHDPAASTKSIQAHRKETDNAIEMRTVWPAPDAGKPGNDFEQSGATVLRLFEGDWFDAAQIYRRWVLAEAGWRPPLAAGGRADTPQWMKEVVVWAQTGGAPAQVVEPTLRFAEFMGVPTALHWYNWHKIPFDNDYPHYFPTKDGFAEGVKRLQAGGVRVMPYINGRLWDRDTDDFASVALPAATKDEKGAPYVERYGSGQDLVPMCPTTKLWQDRVNALVLRLVGPECGVDGVYVDQVAAAAPRLCFDASHGHPLNGGKWWTTRGYWPMITRLQKTMAKQFPDKMITTECNAEPYTHCFDGYLTWNFQYPNQIPLFAAVYGGTIQLFGRAYNGNDQLAHRMRIGQSLVWGEQLGWCNPGILKQKETAAFLRVAAQVRHALLPYLSWGRMARPPDLRGAIPNVTADWAWKKDWKITDSAVQRGAWRADDGRIAFLFANVSDDDVRCTWHFDPTRYGLAGKPLTVAPATAGAEARKLRGPTDIPLRLVARTVTVNIVAPEP